MIFSKATSSLLAFLAVPSLASQQLRGNHERRGLSGQCTGCYPGTFGNCKNTINKVCYSHYTYEQCVAMPGLEPCGADGGGIFDDSGCVDSGSYPTPDKSCTDPAKPICFQLNGAVAVDGMGGDHCGACSNSVRGGGGVIDVDDGCRAEAPVCIGNAGVDLAAHVEGTGCAVCFNSLDSIDACDLDDGCPPSKPDCALDNGLSPQIWHPGTQCVADCRNTAPGFEQDHGKTNDSLKCL